MEDQNSGVPSFFTITLVQFFVGALLFVALLYGQRDLTILTLLVLGIISGARLWARMSLVGLKCHMEIDKRRVFPGTRITLIISAENGKPLPIWLEIIVQVGDLLQRASGEKVLAKASSLLWFQRIRFQWKFTAERRGVYQIGPLHILAGDLFSFFSRRKRVEDLHSIIVYPRLVSLKPLSIPRRDFFGAPRAKSPVQDPVYILGTRDYQYGNPSRYIHWKASARHTRLQEKVFEPTVQEKVLLVVNVDSFSRREDEDDFERTLELVASSAVRFVQQGHSVGLLANGTVRGSGPAFVPFARNYRQLPDILEFLARLEMRSSGDLKNLLRRRLADTWGISCLYFSHAEDETVFSAMEYLAERKTPAVFFVCQPRLAAGRDRPEAPSKTYCLDDIRATEMECA